VSNITLLGRGPSWIECPLKGEIWGTATCLITDGLKDINYSKVFAFDSPLIPSVRNSLDAALERNIPVVSNLNYATELFPTREVAREFRCVYLKSSMSFMIAMAIYSGYTKLRIDGIDQGPNWHYALSKPYVTFWLGVASGRDIDWEMGKGSLTWMYRLDKHNMAEPFEQTDNDLVQLAI